MSAQKVCQRYLDSLKDQKSVDLKILVATAVYLQGNTQKTKVALKNLQVKPRQVMAFRPDLEPFLNENPHGRGVTELWV